MSDLLKQAENRLNKSGFMNLFSSSNKYEDAAELYEKAAIQFKLSKNWLEAAETYEKLTEMYSQIGSNHEVAMNFVESGNCYKKCDLKKSIEMFKKAAKKFSEIGRLSIAAKHLKEVGDMLEKEKKLEESLEAFTAAADLYLGENTESTANQCKLRVASLAGQLERYDMAVETFEDCAKHAAENNLLKYSAKGYLLNAGNLSIVRGRPRRGFKRLPKIQRHRPNLSKFSRRTVVERFGQRERSRRPRRVRQRLGTIRRYLSLRQLEDDVVAESEEKNHSRWWVVRRRG